MYFLIQLTSTVNKRHEVHKHSRHRRVKKPPEQCTSVRILEDRALTPTLSCPERKLRDLVTIATKTFLRPHKLMTMLRSVREYYPDLTVIVADDSKEPLKITDSHVEYYAMPFGKVYSSQRGRHGHLGTRGPQGQVVPWLGLLRGRGEGGTPPRQQDPWGAGGGDSSESPGCLQIPGEIRSLSLSCSDGVGNPSFLTLGVEIDGGPSKRLAVSDALRFPDTQVPQQRNLCHDFTLAGASLSAPHTFPRAHREEVDVTPSREPHPPASSRQHRGKGPQRLSGVKGLASIPQATRPRKDFLVSRESLSFFQGL